MDSYFLLYIENTYNTWNKYLSQNGNRARVTGVPSPAAPQRSSNNRVPIRNGIFWSRLLPTVGFLLKRRSMITNKSTIVIDRTNTSCVSRKLTRNWLTKRAGDGSLRIGRISESGGEAGNLYALTYSDVTSSRKEALQRHLVFSPYITTCVLSYLSGIELRSSSTNRQSLRPVSNNITTNLCKFILVITAVVKQRAHNLKGLNM